MAKKELNDDLLTGGSISDGDKSKAEKAAAKKAARTAKAAEKNAAKRAKYEEEIRTIKESIASETDESKRAELGKKLDKAKANLAGVGSNKGAQLTANQMKVLKSVIAVVVVLALLTAYVGTGTVRKGFIHSTMQWTTYLTAVTVKSEEGDKISVPVSTYNYYYAMTYNNLQSTQSTYEQYGLSLEDSGLDVDFDKPLSKQKTTDDDDNVITWAEKIQNMVVDSIESTYTYYNEAVKANGGEEPEITEEQQEELNDTISQYKENANKYGFTVSGYLIKAMGKGVTEKVFRREATRAYIAQNYQTELNDTTAKTEYTDDDINKYKDENLDALQSVSVRIFEADSEDNAVAFKNALNSNASNFTELCVQYSEDGFDKDYYSDSYASTYYFATKSTLENAGFAIATADHNHEEGEEHSDDEELEYPGLDWLFSTDRKAGDIYQYSTSVVYVISPVELADVNTVNVRHILISPVESGSSTQAKDATDEEWAAAYDKAKSILDEYNAGDKTAESFGALASENSSDTGSASNNGLYENVYPGQMVASFGAWCFDGSRSQGDTAIVKTQYGYHIMYFEGSTDTPVWKYTAQQALASEDSKSAAEKLEESYSAKINWFGSFYLEKDVDIDS